MTQLLRDELARLAEHAPEPQVAADTWSRGRRARRTNRLVGAATALALVVLLGGLTAFVVDGRVRVEPAAPVEEDGAVPTVIHPVPAHVQEPDTLTTELAVGRGALAFVTDDRDLPVVVSARDGSYAVLDLPGWPWADPASAPTLNHTTMRPLALSPDGTRLAWGYADTQGTGVRVADLETGGLEEHPVRGAEFPGPTLWVTSVVFSGDGSRVAWSGTSEDPDASWYGQLTSPDRSTPASSVDGSVTVGVADDGRSLTWTDGFARIPSSVGVGYDDSFDTDGLEAPGPVASFSPDGQSVLFGSTLPQGHVDVGSVTEQRVVRRPLSSGAYPEGAGVEPLGWVDDETAVVLVRPEDGSGAVQVARMGLGAGSAYEVVTRSDAPTSVVTVAVDLLERPTVERPAPDWPWSPTQRLWLLALGVLCLAVVAAHVVRRRRR